MNTITDSKGFKQRIVNADRLKALENKSESDIDKELYVETFTALKNGILEIFPAENNDYPVQTIEYAENFAFIVTEKFVPVMIEYIKKKAASLMPTGTTTPNTPTNT